VKFLLDTNVVSEWIKLQPDDGVARWMKEVDEDSVVLSAATLAELHFGIEKLALGSRRTHLESWMQTDVLERFAGRVLPVDGAVASAWGTLRAQGQRLGRNINVMDCFLAATARVYQLILVTRNIQHFVDCGGELFNPFTAR
jgi:toxin FitB